MSNRRILGAAALASASMAFALIPSIAVAGPPPAGAANTLYVSNAPSSAASAKQNAAGCAHPQYSTVQSAVNAAKPGQTVYLCGQTPYSEWVVVQQNLNLTGDPGATIQAPSGDEPTVGWFNNQNLQTPDSIVSLLGKANVQITGLTIQGPFNSCGGAAGENFGVLALGGPHVQLNSDQVLNITDGSDCNGGPPLGTGVEAGAQSWTDTTGNLQTVNLTANVQVQNTTISSYQDLGIWVDGPGSQGEIQSSTVTGDGLNAQDAQIGILIGDGASGHVHNNTISANETSPSATFQAVGNGVQIAGGCGAPLTKNVEVDHNTLTNNDVGVAVSELDDSCTLAPSKATNVQVHDNTISKSDGETNQTPSNTSANVGYQAGISDIGNGDDIHNNTITDGPTPGDAYGPQDNATGPILLPIDIQTEPTAHVKVHNNTFNGSPTNPPY